MKSGFIVRLRPVGPWRLGPNSGARDRVDHIVHSDTLYSALTLAADQLGLLREWLSATAEASTPDVVVGSAFPFSGRTLLAPAPRHVWPPAWGKIRWSAARFVSLQLIPRLLAHEVIKEDRWAVDPISECLLPIEKFGEVTPPFRVSLRTTAAVDRVSGASTFANATACLEFSEGSGLWCPVQCAPEWRERVQSLFRLLSDTGIGGERSSGWGQSAAPEFEPLPSVLAEDGAIDEQHEAGYWLLGLYAPASLDRVDWSRGEYSLVRRSGRMTRSGELKNESAMVEEGSVLLADAPPVGLARNVASNGAPHPVYRAGWAFAVTVPVRLPGFQALELEKEAIERESPAPVVEEVAVEDAPAIPEPIPEPEVFTVVTEPAPTESEPEADGGVEDAPSIPETLPHEREGEILSGDVHEEPVVEEEKESPMVPESSLEPEEGSRAEPLPHQPADERPSSDVQEGKEEEPPR